MNYEIAPPSAKDIFARATRSLPAKTPMAARKGGIAAAAKVTSALLKIP
ncbi:MAG: hypothetical protein O2967_23605 [Proteobacteria bacterium]|nr:hypothetical protein [Pseudomonadota bacterium]